MGWTARPQLFTGNLEMVDASPASPHRRGRAMDATNRCYKIIYDDIVARAAMRFN
jgi:hypothetical protein